MRNFESDVIIVRSGVTQRSHCGSLLFCLFINDVSMVIQRPRFLLFADDIKIFSAISSFWDALLPQDDLDNLYVWCGQNRLCLNLAKCNKFW